MLVYLQVIETDADRSKFEEIYQAYRGLMYHVAYKYLHHKQDAEDAVHHAFVKSAENIKNIESVSPKTKRLVVLIVENRSIDLLRSKGRHPEETFDSLLENESLQQLEAENLLTSCILKLPVLQRQVILLKYYHGYSLREIAKLLGISMAWAQKIDQRAKKRLKDLYLEGGGDL